MDEGKPDVVIRATPEQPHPLPVWAIVVGTGFAMQILVIAIFVVPQFNDVFRDFGADLPLLTRVLIAPWVGGLWPLLVLIDGLRLRMSGRGGLAGYLVRAVLGTAALIMLYTLAMYLPIFKLAATV